MERNFVKQKKKQQFSSQLIFLLTRATHSSNGSPKYVRALDDIVVAVIAVVDDVAVVVDVVEVDAGIVALLSFEPALVVDLAASAASTSVIVDADSIALDIGAVVELVVTAVESDSVVVGDSIAAMDCDASNDDDDNANRPTSSLRLFTAGVKLDVKNKSSMLVDNARKGEETLSSTVAIVVVVVAVVVVVEGNRGYLINIININK